ncbi:MAG: Ger(x)C family spore germination protein [Clostridiaceae bacterium]
MKKRFKFLISVILTSFIFTGCFNYRDINDVLFVTAIIFDEGDNGEIIMSTEVFKPTRAPGKQSERGQRLTFTGRGKTVFEIVRDLTLTSSKRFNYTQNKAVIFTEKAARGGIKKYIDFTRRDQELLVRPYICIYGGNGKQLLDNKLEEEQYVGMFIFDLINNIGNASRAVKFDYNDYLNLRHNAERTNVITYLKQDYDQGRDSLKIDGAAILQNEIMVEYLTRGESQGYNFIMDKIKSGTLEVPNPITQDSYITLEIRKSKTKTKIEYDGETLNFKKNINTVVTIAESQDNLIVSKEDVEKIQQYAENNIEEYCTNLFNKYKEENIDIFNLRDQFKNKYPKESDNVENLMEKSNIDIEVDVKVKVTGKYNSFN